MDYISIAGRRGLAHSLLVGERRLEPNQARNHAHSPPTARHFGSHVSEAVPTDMQLQHQAAEARQLTRIRGVANCVVTSWAEQQQELEQLLFDQALYQTCTSGLYARPVKRFDTCLAPKFCEMHQQQQELGSWTIKPTQRSSSL